MKLPGDGRRECKPDVLAVLAGACNKLGAQGMATVHHLPLFPLVPRICCRFSAGEMSTTCMRLGADRGEPLVTLDTSFEPKLARP